MGCITDPTREFVRSPTSGRANRDATAHIERDSSNRTHRHHIQQHFILAVLRVFATAFPRRVIFGKSESASVLPPARGGVKVRWVDEGKATEVLRWGSGEKGVPCAGWGEVERSCEL
jgi:hypothetical protein